MKTPGRYLLSLILMCLSGFAFGQGDVQMADTFRAEGKIYVVVAIILIILVGLILFLFALDRKLTRLERMISDKNQTKRDEKSF